MFKNIWTSPIIFLTLMSIAVVTSCNDDKNDLDADSLELVGIWQNNAWDNAYEIRANGKATEHYLEYNGTEVNYYTDELTWTYDSDLKLLVFFDSYGYVEEEFTVVTLTSSTLVVKNDGDILTWYKRSDLSFIDQWKNNL